MIIDLIDHAIRTQRSVSMPQTSAKLAGHVFGPYAQGTHQLYSEKVYFS
jgi:hypothetical protein